MTTHATSLSGKSLSSFGFVALLAVTAATAQVATGTTGIDASGSYRQEVAACQSGKTQQDRATCLKEARNARGDKSRGALNNAGGKFEANATARCNVLSGDDKAACEARVLGNADTSGSVAGGGVLRRTETVVPAADAPATRP
jgi:hypothetical protein